MRTVEAVLLVMLGIEFQHLVRLVFVFRRDGVFAHVVDAVSDDRRHAGLGQRGKTAGSQRKIEAVGEVMECVDERAVKVKYAELYHDCFFLSFLFLIELFFDEIQGYPAPKAQIPSIAPSVCQTGRG
ncbi:hypothetical protein SDC9_147409 [bioreactor metagenome]|uniref:Uncharacterized protein n=1 Tax=bioreactor metagenome TaxID=1076179 RepID=A0A645EDT2_9ZZZZ